jgi:hypothetical protein
MTRWNRLALVVALGGAALTILGDQLHLRRWAQSGIRMPVGEATTIDLPEGDLVAYYESSVAVPNGNVLLAVRGADGAIVPPRLPYEESNFRVLMTGWSGRALWRLDGVRAGPYTVIANNPNFLSNEEVPPDDRIVFAKEPATFTAFDRRRKAVQLTGAGITVVATVLLYCLHVLALRSRPTP